MDIYNRILSGKIMEVNAPKCTCKVQLTDISSTVECQLGYPFVSGNSSIRFMPKGGESISVGFTPMGVPKILSFFAPPEYLKLMQDIAGETFYRELNPGDIVLQAGPSGAEVYLEDNGNVSIGSGASIIQMDALRRAVEFITGMIRWTLLSGVDLSAGYVIRNIEGVEQRFPGLVEYRVEVNNVTGKVSGLKMGDIVDELGVPEIGLQGLTKNFSWKSYVGLIPVGEVYADKGGGITVQGSRDVTIVGGVVYLGTLAAAFSAVKGETLVLQIQQLITAVTTALNLCQAKPGEDAALAAAIGGISAISATLPTVLSPTVRVP